MYFEIEEGNGLGRNHGCQARRLRIQDSVWCLATDSQEQRARSALEGDLEPGQEGRRDASSGMGVKGSLSKASDFHIDFGSFILFYIGKSQSFKRGV